jgi:hypothetical protein
MLSAWRIEEMPLACCSALVLWQRHAATHIKRNDIIGSRGGSSMLAHLQPGENIVAQGKTKYRRAGSSCSGCVAHRLRNSIMKLHGVASSLPSATVKRKTYQPRQRKEKWREMAYSLARLTCKRRLEEEGWRKKRPVFGIIAK